MRNFKPAIKFDIVPVWSEPIKTRINVLRVSVIKTHSQKPEFHYFQFSAPSVSDADNLDDNFMHLFNSLTPREKEILRYVADGLTSLDISKRLGISLNTVKNHRKNFKKKLNFRNSITYSKFLRWVAHDVNADNGK